MNTFQPIEILRAIPKILQAFPMTMLILLSSLLFSLLIGAAFAMMSLSRHKALNAISKGYVSFMRGIPTLILIFLIYLGLPQLLKQIGVDMSGISLTAYIIACLSLSVSANMSEMMRSAYLAVDKGQREAAWSVGMSSTVAFFRIILPQAVGIAIPTLGNNIIMLFKETSLAFTIGVLDIKIRHIVYPPYELIAYIKRWLQGIFLLQLVRLYLPRAISRDNNFLKKLHLENAIEDNPVKGSFLLIVRHIKFTSIHIIKIARELPRAKFHELTIDVRFALVVFIVDFTSGAMAALAAFAATFFFVIGRAIRTGDFEHLTVIVDSEVEFNVNRLRISLTRIRNVVVRGRERLERLDGLIIDGTIFTLPNGFARNEIRFRVRGNRVILESNSTGQGVNRVAGYDCQQVHGNDLRRDSHRALGRVFEANQVAVRLLAGSPRNFARNFDRNFVCVIDDDKRQVSFLDDAGGLVLVNFKVQAKPVRHPGRFSQCHILFSYLLLSGSNH